MQTNNSNVGEKNTLLWEQTIINDESIIYSLMLFQTHLTFFLLWNMKARNVKVVFTEQLQKLTEKHHKSTILKPCDCSLEYKSLFAENYLGATAKGIFSE